MKKKIWLINQYAVPPKYESRIQTLKRAQYLQKFGYDVTIIGGSYVHNSNIDLLQNEKKAFVCKTYDGIKFIHVKTKKYNDNGWRRFYNLIEFPIRLLLISKKIEKPDVIVQTATVPFGNMLYILKKRFKVKYIVDVLDLWPETFFALGMVSKHNPLLRLSYYLEKWLYLKADKIVFSMEGGKKYIKEKGWDKESGGVIDTTKIHYINNGVDLKDFKENLNKYEFRDSDLDSENDDFNIVYLGSIRKANEVKNLIEAASLLISYQKIKILIFGDGEDREKLENYCSERKLNNIIFKQKWVELKYVPSILSKSSLNILNYSPNPIWRFGGSQSKLFQYMASGKPICSNLKMSFCPINKYNLGIAKHFNTPKEYAESILSIYNMSPEEYDKLCHNSRETALKYDYELLTRKFENQVLQ